MTIEQLYKTKYAYVYRVATKWHQTVEHAEDATQEFFLWLHENLHKYDGRIPFKNWFIKNLVYEMHHYRYGITRRKDTPFSEIQDESGDFVRTEYDIPDYSMTEEIDRAMTRSAVSRAVKKLSGNKRAVHEILLNNEDITYEQIGKKLRMSANGVRFNYSESLPQLKKALKEIVK